MWKSFFGAQRWNKRPPGHHSPLIRQQLCDAHTQVLNWLPVWCFPLRAAGFREEPPGYGSHHQHPERPLGARWGKRSRIHRDLGACRWRRAGCGKTAPTPWFFTKKGDSQWQNSQQNSASFMLLSRFASSRCWTFTRSFVHASLVPWFLWLPENVKWDMFVLIQTTFRHFSYLKTKWLFRRAVLTFIQPGKNRPLFIFITVTPSVFYCAQSFFELSVHCD